MRALRKMTWVELKLYLRDPIGTFFTLAFPLLLLFIFANSNARADCSCGAN